MGRTSRLLNAQAMNLDVVDVSIHRSARPRRDLTRRAQVVDLVPPEWSLSTISSFLSRSFRRTLHARQEGQIIKAIATAQNHEVRPTIFFPAHNSHLSVDRREDLADLPRAGGGH